MEVTKKLFKNTAIILNNYLQKKNIPVCDYKGKADGEKIYVFIQKIMELEEKGLIDEIPHEVQSMAIIFIEKCIEKLKKR